MILIDTCALLWLVAEQNKLSKTAVAAIQQHPNAVFISAISAFEIGVKYQKGKLRLPLKSSLWFAKAIELHQLTELPVTSPIASLAPELPRHHSDPIDRIIIATAMHHKLSLLTPDHQIKQYSDLRVIW